jgi:hypothetical protein
VSGALLCGRLARGGVASARHDHRGNGVKGGIGARAIRPPRLGEIGAPAPAVAANLTMMN